MPSLSDSSTGRTYWRSLDELTDSPEVRAHLEREFPHLSDLLGGSATRRSFLKVMGASLALGGLAGCRWPRETIVPYAKTPNNRLPGAPVSFATTYELAGVGTGLLVTSYDGRPIKIEGNPAHPASLGATDVLMQAAILEMYDPDRSTTPYETAANTARSWDQFFAAFSKLASEAKSRSGAGVFVLAEPSSSPTLAAARAALLAAMPQATWVEYDPLSRDNERVGTALAFGAPLRPVHDFSHADVIVALDSDFLFTHPASLRYTRDFARRRSAADGKMNRLHVVENTLSLTGSNADHRYAVRASDIASVLMHLAAELAAKGVSLPAAAQALSAAIRKLDAAGKPAFVAGLAADLLAAKGRGVILVGPRQPAEVHALAHVLNAALENVGKSVRFTAEADAQRPSHVDAIAALADGLEKGAVELLLILGGNPALNAPADLDFAGKLAKAKASVHLSLYRDETSRRCTWHAPLAHFLESWGDARAWDGTLSITQPLIEPLFNGKTALEVTALLAGESNASGYELVRKTFKASLPSGENADVAWTRVLEAGVVPKSAAPTVEPTVRAAEWAARLDALARPTASDAFEIVFAQDHKVYDGRFANNGWLQELPDPITKLTWDTAAMISPQDARRLRIRRDDRVTISLGAATIDVPVCVVPGHAPGSITLPLGYGRDVAGPVAKGAGFNFYPLRSRAAFHIASGASVKPTGRSYKLVTTQDHHGMSSDVTDHEIQHRVPVLVREGTLADYLLDRKSATSAGGHVHSLPLVQMFGDAKYGDDPVRPAPRWGMAIDLTKCTGCSACVVACQAENNIPIVGKEEVARGREMHWIRIDRYFKGEPDDPALKVVHQPVTCQQCENAPCEQVCPVSATNHDEQGINVMVYNRCIGTRYCSNNCPYKVRRFNWFYNHHGPKHPRNRDGWVQTKLTEIEKLAHNPNVTVRTRGVMEKCTFCIQRLQRAKIAARNEQVNPSVFHEGQHADVLADGAVTTACAQVCPAEAITFGDLRIDDSQVAKAHRDDRAYTLLEELNIRPRTRYLAKLRNPQHGGAPAAGHGTSHG